MVLIGNLFIGEILLQNFQNFIPSLFVILLHIGKNVLTVVFFIFFKTQIFIFECVITHIKVKSYITYFIVQQFYSVSETLQKFISFLFRCKLT